MTVATVDIAQSLGMSEPELMQRALKTFLQEQRREVLQTRLEILARYGVSNAVELEARISESTAPEHPGWEDLIVVDNLDARLEELDAYPSNL